MLGRNPAVNRRGRHRAGRCQGNWRRYSKRSTSVGGLDFLIHSTAWARKEELHGRLTDCSAEGFVESMTVSCHSLILMVQLAEPLMDRGICLAQCRLHTGVFVRPHAQRLARQHTDGDAAIREAARRARGLALRGHGRTRRCDVAVALPSCSRTAGSSVAS
ncbi:MULTISPECIES: SDR family oxidoreductase [Halomonadaceae]|uniref:SDR family oxidoreductase n=1 Tax=Halomonadaceae TaxID=28256 RepID=UPI001C432551